MSQVPEQTPLRVLTNMQPPETNTPLRVLTNMQPPETNTPLHVHTNTHRNSYVPPTTPSSFSQPSPFIKDSTFHNYGSYSPFEPNYSQSSQQYQWQHPSNNLLSMDKENELIDENTVPATPRLDEITSATTGYLDRLDENDNNVPATPGYSFAPGSLKRLLENYDPMFQMETVSVP